MRKTERCVVVTTKKNRPYCMTIAIDSSFNVEPIESFDSFAMIKFYKCRSLKYSTVFFFCCSFGYYNRNGVGHSLFSRNTFKYILFWFETRKKFKKYLIFFARLMKF